MAALVGGFRVAVANKLTTLKLGDNGWVVDAVIFRDLARDLSCDDPDKAEFGRTPVGGYYAQCASTQTLTGKTVPRQVKLIVAITIDKIDTACSIHSNPELDPDDVAVCKSLRKLDAPKSK